MKTGIKSGLVFYRSVHAYLGCRGVFLQRMFSKRLCQSFFGTAFQKT